MKEDDEMTTHPSPLSINYCAGQLRRQSLVNMATSPGCFAITNRVLNLDLKRVHLCFETKHNYFININLTTVIFVNIIAFEVF